MVEKLSIAMMKAWFEARGYSVHIVDPVKQLLAQGGYLESSVDIDESTKRVDAKSIGKDKVVLMAGFTACNDKGELVLLGRNGSDYSAACLAACLDASVCEIWTDGRWRLYLWPTFSARCSFITKPFLPWSDGAFLFWRESDPSTYNWSIITKTNPFCD